MPRTLTLYIAMSLDGYIAGPDGDISFLDAMMVEGEDYGFNDFINTVDTIIWGRKTFDKVLSFGGELPHRDKSVYVISRSRTGTHEHVRFHNDPVQLATELKQQEGPGIYCDGGGEIVTELLQHDLIDRLIISVVPHLLGSGVRLFRDGRPGQKLRFVKSESFTSGLVQLWYER
ncbi:MAG: dihydrofolate reductase family protein [Cyclobacteriaceae bacterium]